MRNPLPPLLRKMRLTTYKGIPLLPHYSRKWKKSQWRKLELFHYIVAEVILWRCGSWKFWRKRVKRNIGCIFSWGWAIKILIVSWTTRPRASSLKIWRQFATFWNVLQTIYSKNIINKFRRFRARPRSLLRWRPFIFIPLFVFRLRIAGVIVSFLWNHTRYSIFLLTFPQDVV